MTHTHSFDEARWIAALGTAIDRATAADPITPGIGYRSGTATLAFCVDTSGAISDIRVIQGSGDDSLDRRAIAKLRRAEPLPHGPAGAARRTHLAVVQVAEPIRLPQQNDEKRRILTIA
ncbi:MAG: energy transducer TonB [Pseudomonadota bacterium]|uniref:energy transducer TonB n=1 Tax=Sphingomonas sp. ERG5 TaxID=1381597 RepID=UPI001364D19F|nr:energy transducer TonB [Sphingomonas sp. ERG5]